MTLWFGSNSFGPVCTEESHVSTPVGDTCEWCEEEIEAGDCGVIFHKLRSLTPEIWEMKPNHQECFLRRTLGSVAHIERRCSCYVAGSCAYDPPEMTVREAARAAVQAWLKVFRIN
jgi:hypothetical protein